MRAGQANRNQSNKEVNGAACEELEIQVDQPTEESVRQRAVELFSDGSGVPAVPPKHPPVSENPTIKLCTLALPRDSDTPSWLTGIIVSTRVAD